jgi:hypothetical protein
VIIIILINILLYKKLLVKKKEERLGFLDALLIKEELFFKSYSWSALQLKRVDPPFFPGACLSSFIFIMKVYIYIYL